MKKTVFFAFIAAFILRLGFSLNSISVQAASVKEQNITIGDDDSNTNNLPYGDTNHDRDNARNYPDRPRRIEPNTSQNPRNINNRNYNTNDNRVNYTQTATTDDGDVDYGWIGLFGLLGLLGLLRGGRKS